MKGGIMKFMNKTTRSASLGKKCFPQKQLGVSKEAPPQFQLKNTLIDKQGYQWNQHNTQPLLSHARYVSIVGTGHTTNDFHQQHQKRIEKDDHVFNKRKGLLSQYLNKHGWKNQVIPLMGSQRSPQGRRLNNNDILKMKQNKKQKLSRKSKSFYNKSLDQSTYYQTLPVYTIQKNRIRKQRNQLYDQQSILITQRHKIKRKIDSSSMDQYIQNKQDNVSFLRLCCPDEDQSRPSSQTRTRLTADSWFCRTARQNNSLKNKRRKASELKNKQMSKLTVEQLNMKQIDEFEKRFTKNGIFKAVRSKYNYLKQKQISMKN